ncbi:MAG: KEOPS complex kinase/ATPase Bud32 [Candidatus Altiarchaeia archaeon]
MELLAKGAEANIYLENGRLVKERIAKKYRVPELDVRLRKIRTQREAKLLENALKAGMPVPKVYKTDMRNYKIYMEYIDGLPLKAVLDAADESAVKEICAKIGTALSVMHNANIIHNDLTTSNMLYADGIVYYIDFGLGSTTTRIEDKAMDLVVFKRSLQVAHSHKFKAIWAALMDSYGETKDISQIMGRIDVIERRARYMESS